MANTRVPSLFVITLLQLCRAEIADKLPESWYSANVINDGFQPKSLSEIFSTASTFSPTNPIVVLPTSTPIPDRILSSTLLPPSSINEELTKTSIIPSSTQQYPDTSYISSSKSTDREFSSIFPSQSPQVEITQFTELTRPPPQDTYSTTRDDVPPPSTRFLIPINHFPERQTTNQQSPSSTSGPGGDYVVVYQQNPQSIQGNPSLQGGLFGPDQVISTRQPDITKITPSTTTVPPPPIRFTSRNRPPTTLMSTSRRPTTRNPSTRNPSTRNMSTRNPSTAEPMSRGPRTNVPILPTQAPTRITSFAGQTTHMPTTQFIQPNRNNENQNVSSIVGLPVRIRVLGPRGSITRVNINPPGGYTTSTKAPTTRRTPKPKKNTYEACINGCKARREPICAIPLSATWIDPDQLKGFPTICHMACFNSYRKEPYEKLLDGRCGRLRTRIQTLDSRTKLKKDELNKSQYAVVGGDHTIVEVSPLRHK